MRDVPELLTARLRLRMYRASDYDAYRAMWSDPDVLRFIGGKPSSPQESWLRLLRQMGHWIAMGYGFWAIEERESGRFIGEAGFADFKRDIDPRMQHVPELGYMLVADAHGKGYGTEAVHAAVEWADAHLPSHRTVCVIADGNAISLRIAERAGYRVFDRGAFSGSTVLFCERMIQ